MTVMAGERAALARSAIVASVPKVVHWSGAKPRSITAAGVAGS